MVNNIGTPYICSRLNTKFKKKLITINKEMTYSTGGGPNPLPLPEASSFAFGTDVQRQIIIEPDGIAMAASYTLSADASQLTLSFNYQGSGFTNTKVESVEGFNI